MVQGSERSQGISDRTVRSTDEAEEIVRALRQGAVDAFVISESGQPQVYALVKAREELQRSQDRLQIALDAADMATWECDLSSGTITRCLRHDELFGYSEKLPAWSLDSTREHVLPEDRSIFDDAFERAVTDGKLHLEVRVPAADGAVRWLRFVGRTYYDDEGQPVRITGVVMDETERQHATDLVRERDRQFAAMADAMPQLVWAARPDGTTDYFNRRTAEYDGMELRDDGIWEWAGMLHPDDVAHTTEAWQRSLEHGSSHHVEHRARMKDGSYRWHLSRALPVRDEATGEIVRWFGTSTDIHAIKEAEAEARVARERLEIALEAAEMGTWETDFTTTTSHRSRRHDQIFGYDELQPVWNLEIARAHVLPQDLEAFDRAVEEGERSGHLRHEVRIRRPDGQVRWIYSLGRYYRDEEGKVVRRAGVIMDVTDRREAEDALRRLNETLEEQVAVRTAELEAARDHFQTLFHASPTAAAILHRRNGRLLDVNDEYARFFGYPREELVGRTMEELGLWADPEHRKRIVRQVMRQQSLRNEEVVVRLSTGEERIVLAAVEPIRLGTVPAALVKFVDITERKRAEAAVRKLSSALTLAEQRERRRLSQVLHDDLQQILFGVEMRAAILQQSVPENGAGGEYGALLPHLAELRDLVVQAVRSTRVLAVELNPPVLRDEGLGAALAWLARHMAEMHGLDVDVEIEPDLDIPFEDQRILIVQLARELLFNVVKHAAVTQARMEASMSETGIELRVEDEGVGFDVTGVRGSRRYRDSLGLFSVEERVRLFGGRLTIDSAIGHGTRILIELPLMSNDGGSPYDVPSPLSP